MKTGLFIALICVTGAPCDLSDGDYLLRAEVLSMNPPPAQPETLAYDDGTPRWITWSGNYRGVWFELTDFVVPLNHQLTGAEMWFYHHAGYPWDTSSFLCEAWLGDIVGPMTMFNSMDCIAQHYSPVYCQFDWVPVYPLQFWVVLNMEMSMGGWPSILCDGSDSGSDPPRSYFSNDRIVWIPWCAEEGCCLPLEMEALSWGRLKTVF